jgi:hypothetical protein
MPSRRGSKGSASIGTHSGVCAVRHSTSSVAARQSHRPGFSDAPHLVRADYPGGTITQLSRAARLQDAHTTLPRPARSMPEKADGAERQLRVACPDAECAGFAVGRCAREPGRSQRLVWRRLFLCETHKALLLLAEIPVPEHLNSTFGTIAGIRWSHEVCDICHRLVTIAPATMLPDSGWTAYQVHDETFHTEDAQFCARNLFAAQPSASYAAHNCRTGQARGHRLLHSSRSVVTVLP